MKTEGLLRRSIVLLTGLFIHEYGLSPGNAGKEMARIDRERVNYCRHYTHMTRGKPGSYDLSIDSSVTGIENAAKIIVDALNGKST